jgi:twitching motility protein PilT
MVGEMRDTETILAAMNAAETGHLVMSTLHTIDTVQTVDRIVDSFPGDQHTQVRGMLASALTAVVSLRLLRKADGQGRVPAVEVLIATPTVRSLIREAKTRELHNAIKSGAQYGMQTFDQSLLALVGKKLITPEIALAEATGTLEGSAPGSPPASPFGSTARLTLSQRCLTSWYQVSESWILSQQATHCP